jgi:hypothetical protein
MEKEPNKKQRNKWIALINIPFQMGVIIFLFGYLGNWLDEKHSRNKINYSVILVLVGVGLALYNVIRQVNEINKTK